MYKQYVDCSAYEKVFFIRRLIDGFFLMYKYNHYYLFWNNRNKKRLYSLWIPCKKIKGKWP